MYEIMFFLYFVKFVIFSKTLFYSEKKNGIRTEPKVIEFSNIDLRKNGKYGTASRLEILYFEKWAGGRTPVNVITSCSWTLTNILLDGIL